MDCHSSTSERESDDVYGRMCYRSREIRKVLEEGWDPLYQDSPICEKESPLLIHVFTTRHGLSDVAVEDLLHLISLHCPLSNKCTSSLFRYKRITSELTFRNSSCAPAKKYICGMCHQETAPGICQNRECNRYDKKGFKPNVLITVPMASQLSQLVSGEIN